MTNAELTIRLPDAQSEELSAAFELHNGKKECVDLVTLAMGGAFTRRQVSQQMRRLGLKRNKMVPAQVRMDSWELQDWNES